MTSSGEDFFDGPLALLSVLVKEQISWHSEPTFVSEVAERLIADQRHRSRQVTVVFAEVDHQGRDVSTCKFLACQLGQ